MMKQKPVKAVLFDFDGTVFDTVEGITKSIQYAIRKHGMDAQLEELRCFAGPPLIDKFMEVYGVTEEEAKQLVTEFRERYVRLHLSGKRIGLATSKPQALAELLLERSGMKDSFDVIVGSGGGVHNDAKWQIVTRAMELCGAETDTCILIGDTKYDVEGAKLCGIPCVGVRWGYAETGELEAAGASAIVESTDELCTWILERD